MLAKACFFKLLATTFFIVFSTAFSKPSLADNIRAPEGWDDTTVNGMRVLTKPRSTIRVGPWQSLEGQTIDVWLGSMENTPPEGARIIVSKGIVKEAAAGAYTVYREVAFGDSTGFSLLYACPGGNGYARLTTLDVTDSGLRDALEGGLFIQEVCEKEEKPSVQATADSARLAHIAITNATSTTQALSDKPSYSSGTAAPGNAPAGLLELRGIIVMGIQGDGTFGVTDDFIALFNDGSYTSDLANTFNDSIEASKNKKPKKWGQWRTDKTTLSLRGQGDSDFEETSGSWRIEPNPKDHRLSGCFGRLTSNSGGDYTGSTIVGVARTWCFWPDGRFTNASSAFGNSSDVSMGVSDKARGSYRIDGYVAQFTYDDGHTITAAFGYANDEGNHILLNGRRFMGAKR